MKPLPLLTSENIAEVLQSLLTESAKEIEEPYHNQWNKHRLAYLRQAIKVVELWIEHERFNEIEARLDLLDGLASDIRINMHSEEASQYIRSRQNGV